MNREREIVKASIYGIIGNALLVAFKMAVGFMSHSIAPSFAGQEFRFELGVQLFMLHRSGAVNGVLQADTEKAA